MLKRKQIQRLHSKVEGTVLTPEEDGFHNARHLRFQGSDGSVPQLIVRPYDADDVVEAIRFVQEVDIPLAVKGGGCHPAGTAAAEDGLLLAMSSMKSIQVNSADQWAITQTGVTWGEFDQVTQVFGLACTGATIPDAGIVGQTLSGGIGWLHRKQGLSCDHVISAELATADGKLLNVSEEENPDLLWALKGAGQHFGVVTSIAYQLEEMEPEVLAGYVTYPLDKLRDLTPHHRELSDTFPDELSTWLIVETGQDGAGLCRLVIFYAGDLEEGRVWHQKLISFAPPTEDTVSRMTYLEWQMMSPFASPTGQVDRTEEPQSWHCLDLEKFPPGMVDVFQNSIAKAPSEGCKIVVAQMGGAVRRAVDEFSAIGAVEAENRIIVIGAANTVDGVTACSEWAAGVRDSFFNLGGRLSDPGLTGADVPRTSLYSATAIERLNILKADYDPETIFGPGF